MQKTSLTPDFRISHKGNIVENVGERRSTFGDVGRHVRPIAKPHPFIRDPYQAREGAHRDALISAARSLDVVIHRYSRRRFEVITKNTIQ